MKKETKNKIRAEKARDVRNRKITQWLLAPIVIIVIGLGWRYPILGFTVPAVMLTGMVGGFIRGRYVCGNLCPRGGFFDRILALVSPKRKIPAFFQSMKLRWTVFALLMGFMAFQISRNPSSWQHWGQAFWFMCAFTTGIGLVLGIFLHHRAWCVFCPIGTFQNAVGGEKYRLNIRPSACRECRTCENACPIAIPIVAYKKEGVIASRDCLKCPECIGSCPCNAITWPK